MLTLGLGVRVRCEIPKEMEKPSVRSKSAFLECHQGRGFTDKQKPKADLGTFSDASCITHGVNFTGGSVLVSEPWDVQYIHGQDDRCFLALALQLSGLAPAKTNTNQVRRLMKQSHPFAGALPGRSQQRGAAASPRRYGPIPKGKKTRS